ncbi:Dual specificity phosphatase, catalytic domain containing protein [Tritrichomonas foetus]|uniref:protein-tyrosine-phosphatase n=1 Tax=Tritrichomonas foetus TaxID=1144522 RepID=A0A1J4K7Q5_9EUKA|nr:Dual specificity phosphatase, catalytic domain containing protein [Tritrichomonas foetus]|eukprot:OHT07034.1 Dual specificity phosphatase, catalytic domain containing protein [Tritrichomonas foetus]
MLFCDSFSVQQQNEPVVVGPTLSLSLWPISNTPLRSSLRSLSFDNISLINDLKKISVLVVFSMIKTPASNSVEQEIKKFPISEFKIAFNSEGFSEPVNLSNNRGFCFFLNGTDCDCLSRARCLSFTQVINARMISGNTFYKLSGDELFELFPILSQFSIRFPLQVPPLSETSFLPTKPIQFKIFSPKAVDTILKWEKSDKISRWKTHLTEVIDNKIFISGEKVAQNSEILHSKGITHIINCACHMINSATGFIQLDLPMSDGGDENLFSWIFKAVSFIKNAFNENTNNKILIHCIEGVSRSVAICIGYLIITRKCDYDKAFQLVRSRRRVASPHPKFMAQLIQLCEIVGSRKSKTSYFSIQKELQFYLINKKKPGSESNEFYRVMKPKCTEKDGNGATCLVLLDFKNVDDFVGLFKRDRHSKSGIVTVQADANNNSKEDIDFANNFADEIEDCLRVVVNRTFRAYKVPEWIEDPKFTVESHDDQAIYALLDRLGPKLFVGEKVDHKEINFENLMMNFCELKEITFRPKFPIIYAGENEELDEEEEEEEEFLYE